MDEHRYTKEEFLKYINKRLEEQPYSGKWVLPDGNTISCDVGYICEWIEDILPSELDDMK